MAFQMALLLAKKQTKLSEHLVCFLISTNMIEKLANKKGQAWDV